MSSWHKGAPSTVFRRHPVGEPGAETDVPKISFFTVGCTIPHFKGG